MQKAGWNSVQPLGFLHCNFDTMTARLARPGDLPKATPLRNDKAFVISAMTEIILHHRRLVVMTSEEEHRK